MYAQVGKPKENKSQSVANAVSQKQNRSVSTFQFVDNRPEAIAQRKLQEITNNSPRAKKVAQLKEIAKSHATESYRHVQYIPQIPNHDTLQLKAVTVEEQGDYRVIIAASGIAEEFKVGGSPAKDNGWNCVDKYKAVAKVGGNKTIETVTLDNNFLNAQAGHILAQQNGGNGGDPNNVFAQDGGVNNSTYRTMIENEMNSQLKDAKDDEKVNFRVSLHGDPKKEKITKGQLKKVSEYLARSDEETDFEGFSSDEESEMSYKDWKAAINLMAMQEYGVGLDDLPDEPYMPEFEGGMSPKDFYDEYMKDGKAM